MAESKKAAEVKDENVVESGVKIAGETFVGPGASLLLDGDVVGGGAHLAGGFLAKMLIGPPGWFLLAANSYSKSVSDKHLHEHLGSAFKRGKASAT